MSPSCHPPLEHRASAEMDAFQALVQNHAPMVFATARRVTGDAALAEDVAQETFLELSRQGTEAVGSVSAWLHRVAWRKACNAVRSESRRRKHEKAAASEAPHSIEDASWDDLEPFIDEALEELPAPLKDLVVEHFLEGRTQQEVAARTGLSQSTVSRQLDAGLHELRARLRTKGIAAGAGIAALLAARGAEAAPASLGKLALGAGTSTASIATTTLFTMTATKLAVSAVAAATLIGIPFMLLNKHEAAAPISKPAALLPRPVAAAPSHSTNSSPIAPRRYHAPPVPENVRFKIEAMVRRMKNLSPEEVGHDAELKQLSAAFFATGQLDSPEMKKKLDEAIKALNESKGIEHGTMNMDFGEFDSPEFRTWAAAAFSNDKEQVQDWILSRLQGAAFEFAVDPSTEKSTDGVSVHPDTSQPNSKGDNKKF